MAKPDIREGSRASHGQDHPQFRADHGSPVGRGNWAGLMTVTVDYGNRWRDIEVSDGATGAEIKAAAQVAFHANACLTLWCCWARTATGLFRSSETWTCRGRIRSASSMRTITIEAPRRRLEVGAAGCWCGAGAARVARAAMTWWRRLLCRLLGAPTCRSCSAYQLPCIQRCGATDRERIDRYILTGRWPR